MRYYSIGQQDEFAAHILSFKRGGHFLDIGCGGHAGLNNTCFFEFFLDWDGICIDIGDYTEEYKNNRKCRFIRADATKIDYKSAMVEKGLPTRLDFLSLDVDDYSLAALEKLPLNEYRFSVITIEHDTYRIGSSVRDGQRPILEKHGYHRLFSDVLVPFGCSGIPAPYEDWWIDPVMFDMSKLKKLADAMIVELYPENIIPILKNMPDKYYIGT